MEFWMKIDGIIKDLTIILTIGVSLVCIFLYPKFDRVEKKFAHYVILGAIFEIIAFSLVYLYKKGILQNLGMENTLPGLHLYTLLQFIFLCIFFHRLLVRYKLTIPLYLSLAIGSVLIISNTLFIQGIYEYCSFSKVGVELFILICSVIYFLKVISTKKISRNEKGITLFVSAVFVNAGMTILIHLFSNEMLVLDKNMSFLFWTFRAFINMSTQLIILYGVYLIAFKGEDGRPLLGNLQS